MSNIGNKPKPQGLGGLHPFNDRKGSTIGERRTQEKLAESQPKGNIFLRKLDKFFGLTPTQRQTTGQFKTSKDRYQPTDRSNPSLSKLEQGVQNLRGDDQIRVDLLASAIQYYRPKTPLKS